MIGCCQLNTSWGTLGKEEDSMITQGVVRKPVEKTGVDAFDPVLLQETLRPSWLKQDVSGHLEFRIDNRGDGTRLIVHVSSGSRGISLDIVLLALNHFPPANMHEHYQHLCGINVQGIETIVYDVAEGRVDFVFTILAHDNFGKIKIFRTGNFWASGSMSAPKV